MLRIFLLILLISSAAAEDKCPLPFNWTLEKAGMLNSVNLSGSTDFNFTSSDEMIVLNFPIEGKEQAPLQIYRLQNGKWTFDKKASDRLPKTYHPRQIILDDIENDGVKEVIIADHGTDKPPFPGARPVILKKGPAGWYADPAAQKITPAFTFNTTVLPMEDKTNALYIANVGYNTPILLRKNKKNDWDNISHMVSKEIGTDTCLMTALKDDFDANGIPDIYLGGCDRPDKRPQQTHDRFLIRMKDKWSLLPSDVLKARSRDSSWGTDFAKSYDLNGDKKKDIIFAVHDFGFHDWELWAHINHSVPWKFKFSTVKIPLIQEPATEGFVYSVEDIEVPGLGNFLMAQVRSVLRDKKKNPPKLHARLFTFDGKNFREYSSCLPDMLKNQYLNVKRLPGSRNKLLLLPFTGEIYQLTVTKK